MVWPSQVIENRHNAACHVGNHVGNEERGDTIGFSVVDEFGVLVHDAKTTNSGANEDSKFVFQIFREFDAGILKRHSSTCHRKVEEAVHASGIFFIQPVSDFKVGNFGGNLCGVRLRVDQGNSSNPVGACHNFWPKSINTRTQRSYGTYACNHYPTRSLWTRGNRRYGC